MLAGIDTHKDTLMAAVADPAGRLVAEREVPNTEAGFVGLVELFETHQVSRVGIDGRATSAVPSQSICCWPGRPRERWRSSKFPRR